MSKRPKISTGTGDRGETGLFGGGRVPKTNDQVAASGDCDELGACLGLAKSHCKNPERKAWLEAIQTDLFTVMGDISLNRFRGSTNDFGLKHERIVWLESLGADLEASLPPQKGWDLAGTNPESAALHLARTVCRRAERSALAVPEVYRASESTLLWLNRLSDFCFVLALKAARTEKKPTKK